MTAVEILVGITISVLVLAGLVQIFLSTKTTYRVQEGIARLQENGRTAFQFLSKDIRMAGHMGCSNIASSDVSVNVIAKTPPAGVIFDPDTVLTGQNDVASGNSLGAVPGTDVITVRRASNAQANLTGNHQPTNANIQVDRNAGFKQNDILFVTDCHNAHVFEVTNTPGTSAPVTVTHSASRNNNPGFLINPPYGPDSRVMSFLAHTYFIEDTGRTNRVGDPILALSRGTVGGTEELVEGVEDMQITYGVDTDGDMAAEKYVAANQITGVTPDRWRNVVSVRVALLVNSIENTATEVVPYEYEGATTTPSDRRLRHEFLSVVGVRARIR